MPSDRSGKHPSRSIRRAGDAARRDKRKARATSSKPAAAQGPRRSRAAVEPAHALLRSLVHELGNWLAASRLTAHLLARDARGEDTVRGAVEMEALAAQAGALLALVPALLETSPPVLSRSAPARVLEGVAQTMPAGRRRRWRIARVTRALPEMEAELDVLHHLIVTLAIGALTELPERGHLVLGARSVAREIAFVLEDDGPALEPDGAAAQEQARGRRLALHVAESVLRRSGGSVRVARRRGSNRIEVRVPRAGPRRG